MNVLRQHDQNLILSYFCSSAAAIANGPTNVASGTTSSVNPSSSSGRSVGTHASFGGKNGLGNSLPPDTSNKGTTIAFGS